MGNSYFRFKEFTIEQDKCAMKVSTDACILGAWTPVTDRARRVLDIGAGTGLLSLMIAQRSKTAIVDAIELDEAAFVQATANVDMSPWRDRVSVIQADAVVYQYAHQYDLIIVNPPFFNNSLLGNRYARNMARHTFSMSYGQLINILSVNLAAKGIASVLLPTEGLGEWIKQLAGSGLYLVRKLLVYPGQNKPANRVVVVCGKNNTGSVLEEELFIRNDSGTYTEEYTQLMHPFYLDK